MIHYKTYQTKEHPQKISEGFSKLIELNQLKMNSFTGRF